MKTGTAVLALVVAPLLSACTGGRYDCANKDVQDAVLDAFNDAARKTSVFGVTFERPYAKDPEYQSFADRIRDSISMSNIITLQKDDDLGAYACSATFTATAGSISLTNDLQYGVRKVDDGESPFAIFYDTSDFQKLAYPVAIETVKPYVEKHDAEVRDRRQSEHASAMRDNPPISRTPASVLNDLYFTDEERAAAQVYAIELNGDSLSDFVALHRQDIGKDQNGKDTYVYTAACLTQIEATEPGQVNSLERASSGFVQTASKQLSPLSADDARSVDPRPTLEFNPVSKMVRMTTSDGSSFEFSCAAATNG